MQALLVAYWPRTMNEKATPQPQLVRWIIGLPVGLFAALSSLCRAFDFCGRT